MRQRKFFSRTLLNDQVLDRPRPVGGRDGGPGEMWRIFAYRESVGQCQAVCSESEGGVSNATSKLLRGVDRS